MATEQAELKNGSYIDILAEDILSARPPAEEVPDGMPRDDEWSKQAFITGDADWVSSSFTISVNLEETDSLNRNFSTASFKYTDSSLGGNFHINPPPQFTRYADIRRVGIKKESQTTQVQYSKKDTGMGRYYSEAIDDNGQVIHLRFGVPQYNSLTQFFTGFYNSSASSIARTGRMDQSLVSKFLEMATDIISIALLPLLIVPIGMIMLGSAIKFFMKWPSSKFYYLKPTMPMYWQAVSSMVNQISVIQGITRYTAPSEDSVLNQKHTYTEAEYSVFHSIFPEFSKYGRIDVYAISTKTKRLEMRYRVGLQKLYNDFQATGGNTDPAAWIGRVKTFMTAQGEALDVPTEKESKTGFTLESYLTRWWASLTLGKSQEKDGKAVLEKGLRQGAETKESAAEDAASAYKSEQEPDESAMNFFLAEEADGAQWASFKVDYTGPVGESFMNGVGESTLAQKLNSVSASARDMKVNWADGNVDSMGIVKGVLDGATSIMQGVADKLYIGGLAAFAGNAIVDIPKHWESASTKLPAANYTITLISPYGNPISQLFSIYIPLCMLLAGALPLSTGKQSYTAPFMCELYDRGRVITKLGLIDSLSIQRGTSNLGFNNEGQAMAIEVTFSVLDMSTVMSMPINQGFSLVPKDGLFDDENAFSSYLMALSGLSIRDAEQRFPLLKNQITKVFADIDQFFTSSHLAQFSANLPGVNLLGAFMRGAGARSPSGN